MSSSKKLFMYDCCNNFFLLCFIPVSVTMKETKKGLSRVQKLKKRLSRSFGRLGKRLMHVLRFFLMVSPFLHIAHTSEADVMWCKCDIMQNMDDLAFIVSFFITSCICFLIRRHHEAFPVYSGGILAKINCCSAVSNEKIILHEVTFDTFFVMLLLGWWSIRTEASNNFFVRVSVFFGVQVSSDVLFY